MARSRSAGGTVFGLIGVVVVAVLYFKWGDVLRLTADDKTDEVGLWVYAHDVAPGQKVDARVRLDAGSRAVISGIEVGGAGAPQQFDGGGESWAIGSRVSALETGTADVGFAFQVPADTPEGPLDLSFTVDGKHMLAIDTTGYVSDVQAVLTTTIHVYSASTSRWRRIGRVALALGAAAGLFVAIVAVRRRYQRKRAHPSAWWNLGWLALPVVGYIAFSSQLLAAARLHAMPWHAILLGWMAIPLLAMERTGELGKRGYVVRPLVGGDASGEGVYRDASAPQQPTMTPMAVELAWIDAGFRVESTKRGLHVLAPTGPHAFVPLPASGQFGGGEPFTIESDDRTHVGNMLDALVRGLGELRCTTDGEPEMRFVAR